MCPVPDASQSCPTKSSSCEGDAVAILDAGWACCAGAPPLLSFEPFGCVVWGGGTSLWSSGRVTLLSLSPSLCVRLGQAFAKWPTLRHMKHPLFKLAILLLKEGAGLPLVASVEPNDDRN